MHRRLLTAPWPVDLPLTLAPLRRGSGDPTWRFERAAIWRATWTPDGPATLEIRPRTGGVEVRAWGDGAEQALAGAGELLGFADDWSDFRPQHPLLLRLVLRYPGLRLPRTRAVLEALVPAILEQKVTGMEARRAYRALIRRFGETAPGDADLRLPPPVSTLASLPSYTWHPLGVERRRAETIRRASRLAAELEAAAAAGPGELGRRLQHIAGIGPWTAAEVTLRALGDPDAVSIGDYHLPSLVSWALAAEPRGDDARMLELLEPYRGQRGRAIRLLEASGIRPPVYGPPLAPRSIATI